MRHPSQSAAILCGCLLGSYSAALSAESLRRPLPNIVFILADDLGYGDVGCYNKDSKIPTPNLDRLAAQGVRFMDAHAPSAVCTPSRYALLTGRYAWRTTLQNLVLWPWDGPLIAPNRLTVGALLKEHGYATACIGKWHLGIDWPTTDGKHAMSGRKTPCNVDFTRPIANGPITRGFDYYFGVDIPNFPPYCFLENDHTVGIPTENNPTTTEPVSFADFSPVKKRPGPILPGWKWENILPELTKCAGKYIEDSAKAASPKPFFLYFALTAPHYPVAPTQEFKGKSQAGDYGDFVVEVDWTVGQVLDTLERSGIADNTLVVFTSDNGPESGEIRIGVYDRIPRYHHYSMGQLRGIKRDTWEGGHRVPFMACWPGKIKAGTVSDETISHVDFLATVAALVGATLPDNAGEDSYNILPALLDQPHPLRPPLVIHSGVGEFALRDGDWIYIDACTGDTNYILGKGKGKGGEPDWFKKERGYEPDNFPGALYNLKQDPAEHRNLYAEQPEKVREFQALLKKYKSEGRSTPGTPQQNDGPIRTVRAIPSADSSTEAE